MTLSKIYSESFEYYSQKYINKDIGFIDHIFYLLIILLGSLISNLMFQNFGVNHPYHQAFVIGTGIYMCAGILHVSTWYLTTDSHNKLANMAIYIAHGVYLYWVMPHSNQLSDWLLNNLTYSFLLLVWLCAFTTTHVIFRFFYLVLIYPFSKKKHKPIKNNEVD